MKSKEERKKEARKEYWAIVEPALKEYEAIEEPARKKLQEKLKRIENEE